MQGPQRAFAGVRRIFFPVPQSTNYFHMQQPPPWRQMWLLRQSPLAPIGTCTLRLLPVGVGKDTLGKNSFVWSHFQSLSSNDWGNRTETTLQNLVLFSFPFSLLFNILNFFLLVDSVIMSGFFFPLHMFYRWFIAIFSSQKSLKVMKERTVLWVTYQFLVVSEEQK